MRGLLLRNIGGCAYLVARDPRNLSFISQVVRARTPTPDVGEEAKRFVPTSASYAPCAALIRCDDAAIAAP
jgi:hypothetical protein